MRGILITAAAAAALAAGSPTRAATIVVTTTADVTSGVDGQTSLREAFASATAGAGADEIVLAAAASYTLTDCAAGDLEHPSADPLVLTGNGATIEQTCPGERVIDNSVLGSDLAVDGVTFEIAGGGAAIPGAAILAAGLAGVSNSTISGLDAGGDAVLSGAPSESTTFVLENVLIENNDGEGVRVAAGALTLIDSTVTGQSGSGIALVDGSPVLVQNSTVSNNGGIGVRTTGLGGSEMTLVDATIVGNGGAGVECSACGTVTIESSAISGNGTAVGPSVPGGGLRVSLDQDSPGDVRVVTITDSQIENNASSDSGGGIRIDILESSELTAPPAELVIDGSTVSGNVADGDAPVHGGGIYVETGGLSLVDSNVDGNRAGPLAGDIEASGGGIYIEELGVIVQTSNLVIAGSTIDGNQARGEGGGIYWRKPGAIDVSGSSIDGNAAAAAGGGVFSVGADVTLLESVVSGNAASVGGALRIVTFFDEPPGSLLVERSTLSGNTASAFGGAIAVDADGFSLPVTVRNATLSGNDGTGFGGAVYTAFGGELVLDHATVVDNAAAEGANLSLDNGPVSGSFAVSASVIALPGGGTNCALGGDPPTSGGHSFADDASCALGPDDVVAMVDPGLAPLADNGGPTPTRLPAPDGPLGGLVPPVACTLAIDQRGVARPDGPACEPGAVEVAEAMAAPITGTPGNDRLVGTPGDDVIVGLGGDDVILGLGGNDVIVGGPGRDTLVGGEGDDRLEGEQGRDLLLGGAGDDELSGGNGRDVLLGGPDTDALDGGRGRDLCLPQGGTSTDC